MRAIHTSTARENQVSRMSVCGVCVLYIPDLGEVRGANDMPDSLGFALNGTFREFSDGFEELGIPRPRQNLFCPFCRAPSLSLSLSGDPNSNKEGGRLGSPKVCKVREEGMALCDDLFPRWYKHTHAADSVKSPRWLFFGRPIRQHPLWSTMAHNLKSFHSPRHAYTPLRGSRAEREIYKRKRESHVSGSRICARRFIFEWEQFGV